MPLGLRVSSDSGSRSHPLNRPRAVIGRGEDCDIVLPDPTVSRRHLVLELEDGLVRFRDVGGTNGLLLDGRPAVEGVLAPGSFLLVGLTRLEVEPGFDPRRTRAIADAHHTVTVLRREPGTTSPPQTAVDSISAIRALCGTALIGPDFTAELAPRVLRAALALTGRSRGLLAERAEGGHLQVLAAEPADPALFPLPAEALEPSKDALAVDPWPDEPPERERILAPVGPNHLLVLGWPEPGAPKSCDGLAIAVDFAPIAAAELEDARRRELERRELDHLRFRQSHAARSLQACTRLHALRRRVAEAAALGRTIRLLGEEGCEAEEVARFFHASSQAKTGPFVACYARLLPPQRIAEDLSDPRWVREGRPECDVQAHGGTLFVDSPEGLPDQLQVKLAEIIERHSAAGPARSFHLVVSTVLERGGPPALHPDLDRALASILNCLVPPLRTAPQDAVALADVILEDLGPTSDGGARRLTEDAEHLLRTYHWPGNARQHRRTIEVAAARAGSNPIAPRHFPVEVREATPDSLQIPTIREVERAHILRVLFLCGGSKAKAAHRLGISASTLYEKLKRMGLDE